MLKGSSATLKTSPNTDPIVIWLETPASDPRQSDGPNGRALLGGLIALAAILIGCGLLSNAPERSLPTDRLLPEPSTAAASAGGAGNNSTPAAVIGDPQLHWRPTSGLDHIVSATAPVKLGDEYLLMANIGSAIGFTSKDGHLWSRAWPLSPGDNPAVVVDLTAAADIPVAVGRRGDLATAWTKEAEFGWTETALPGEGLLPVSVSSSGDNLVIAAASDTSGGNGHFWWSHRGEGWDLLEIPTADAAGGFSVIPAPGGGFVAVLPDGELWSSLDGRSWAYERFAGVQHAVPWGERLIGANNLASHLNIDELSEGMTKGLVPVGFMPERRLFWRVEGLAADENLGIIAAVQAQRFRSSSPWWGVLHSLDGRNWSRVSLEEIAGTSGMPEMVSINQRFALMTIRYPDLATVEVFTGELANG